MLGNETNPASWSFGIPTLWVWQIAWWIIGCVMMYLLAFKLQMSTAPESEVESLVDSDGDPAEMESVRGLSSRIRRHPS